MSDRTEYEIAQTRPGLGLLMPQPLSESFTSTCRPVLGMNFSEMINIYHNGTLKYYMKKKELATAMQNCLEKTKKEPLFGKKLIGLFEKESAEFLIFCQGFNDCAKKTNKEIISLIEEYDRQYIAIYPFGEPFPFCLKDLLAEYLSSYLKTICAPLGINEKEQSRILSILFSPMEKSFTSIEEEDFLRIVSKTIERGKIDSEIRQLVKKHTERFEWLPVDYESPEWTEEYFLKLIEESMKKDRFNIQERIKKLAEREKTIGFEQKKLFEELKIDSYHKSLFEALQTASYSIDFKKTIFTQCHFQFLKLIKDTSKRTGIEFELLKLMSIEEIKKILLGKFDKAKLKGRKELAIMHIVNGKARMLSKEEAKKIALEMEEKEISNQKQDVREITGMCGCPGTVTAKARILLSPKEIGQLLEGEILVTIMTTVDFVPAMKKAAGIITDEGGVTSHAAIVSRELGLPCIIGTKIATKTIRTGDIVELHGATGTAKILQRTEE